MTFERACALADVPTDEALGVTIGAYDVAVARDGDEFFAIQDLCSHAAVALSEGEVDGLHRRVLAARLALRPPHRQAHRPARPPNPSRPSRSRSATTTIVYVDTTTTLNGVTPS